MGGGVGGDGCLDNKKPSQTRQKTASATSQAGGVGQSGLPSLFDYTDYRLFLRDQLAALARRDGARGSLRAIARRMGLQTPSLLSMVASGKRHLPDDKLTACAEALQLDAARREYFELLFLLERSRSEADRKRIDQKIRICFSSGLFKPLLDEGNQYARYWYLPVLREATALSGFAHMAKDRAKLAQSIGVPLAEVEAGFRLLLKLGLLAESASGELVRAEPSVHNFGRTNAFTLLNYNLKILEQSMKAAVKSSRERYFESLTVAIPEDLFAEFKQLIKRFFRELDVRAEGTVGRTRVVQVSLQMFNVFDGGSARGPGFDTTDSKGRPCG